MTANTKYSGEYFWKASPLAIQKIVGNNIENTNSKQINVNTNLGYFDHIIPCGIRGKAVTSLEVELGKKLNVEEVEHVRLRLRHLLSETVATYDGGVWTVGDILSHLDGIPPNLLAYNLPKGLLRLLRDKLLAEKALAADLGRDVRVIEASENEHAAQLAAVYVRHHFGAEGAIWTSAGVVRTPGFDRYVAGEKHRERASS